MKELDSHLKEISAHAQAITDAVRAIRELIGDEAAEQAPADTPTEPEKAYTLEEVRGVLLAKRREGFNVEAQLLIERRGVKKLSEIAPSEYAAIIREAEAIGS